MAKTAAVKKKILKDKSGKYRYGGIIWVALVVWAAYIIISQQIELREQNDVIMDYRAKIEDAERQKKELSDKRDMVGTDEYVEMIARQNLGYTKSNEQVFVDSSKAQ